MRIGIIGGGWYGCHTARALRKAGHEVFIFEKKPMIFDQISGNFGIRLHAGPHYPRSQKTRQSCHRDYELFVSEYPELVVEHDYSIYALGETDANGNPSKTSYNDFKSVCEEFQTLGEIDIRTMGYQGLVSAWNLKEPSVLVGNYLRKKFNGYLSNLGINIICNFNVTRLENLVSSVRITAQDGAVYDDFDYVVNATSYQSFMNFRALLPFDFNVVYQPCLALLYADTMPTCRPFSFIVMDGWFPCMMPYCDNEDDLSFSPKASRKYIVTHGKWTIMGSFDTAKKAENLLSQLDDDFIEQHIRPSVSSEMNRFWPEFQSRFRYLGWKGSVLAKIKTDKEFRSAVTFMSGRLIQIIPGKVSNVFDAANEVFQLINQQNVLSRNNYQYVQGGVLDDAMQEISETPKIEAQNTCGLQTYNEIIGAVNPNASAGVSGGDLRFWKYLKHDEPSNSLSSKPSCVVS